MVANNMNVLNATEVFLEIGKIVKSVFVYLESCQIVHTNNAIYSELFLFSWYHTVSPGPYCMSMTSAGRVAKVLLLIYVTDPQ